MKIGLKARWAAMALAATAAVVLLYALDPGRTVFYPRCPFYVFTGLYCPGCGTARAMHAILHGRFLAALDYNPFAVVCLPFLGYAFAAHAPISFRGRSLPRVFVPPGWIWALLIAIPAYWVARNVPVYPLTLLAP